VVSTRFAAAEVTQDLGSVAEPSMIALVGRL
jgi:hypothetical protein